MFFQSLNWEYLERALGPGLFLEVSNTLNKLNVSESFLADIAVEYVHVGLETILQLKAIYAGKEVPHPTLPPKEPLVDAPLRAVLLSDVPSYVLEHFSILCGGGGVRDIKLAIFFANDEHVVLDL